MKKLRFIICLTLAAAMVLSMSVAAFAKKDDHFIKVPGEVKYTITVKNNDITLSSNIKSEQKYSTKDGMLTVRVDDHGLVMCFTTSGNNYKEVILGKDVKDINVNGSLNGLNLSDTVDYHYTVNVNGKINEFNFAGDCNVNLNDTAVINKLGNYNESAKVFAADNASVISTNKEPLGKLYLDVEIRSYNYFTANSEYDEKTKTLTLRASLPGCTVSDAVKDAIIRVEEQNGKDLVSGRWYWPNLNGGSSATESYVYRFQPTDGRYDSAQITINFIAK
ncbi:MAG: hypothetical protein II995_04550 [Oscillospiraceae bacterium]|nr:hypothetical protein [Oscillospiraceae bacterium]